MKQMEFGADVMMLGVFDVETDVSRRTDGRLVHPK